MRREVSERKLLVKDDDGAAEVCHDNDYRGDPVGGIYDGCACRLMLFTVVRLMTMFPMATQSCR